MHVVSVYLHYSKIIWLPWQHPWQIGEWGIDPSSECKALSYGEMTVKIGPVHPKILDDICQTTTWTLNAISIRMFSTETTGLIFTKVLHDIVALVASSSKMKPCSHLANVQIMHVVSVCLPSFRQHYLVAMASSLDKLENKVQIHHRHVKRFHTVKSLRNSVQYIWRNLTKYAKPRRDNTMFSAKTTRLIFTKILHDIVALVGSRSKTKPSCHLANVQRMHVVSVCLHLIRQHYLVTMATSLDKLENKVQIYHRHVKRFHMVKRLWKSVQRILRYFGFERTSPVRNKIGCHGNIPWGIGKMDLIKKIHANIFHLVKRSWKSVQ